MKAERIISGPSGFKCSDAKSYKILEVMQSTNHYQEHEVLKSVISDDLRIFGCLQLREDRIRQLFFRRKSSQTPYYSSTVPVTKDT